VLDRLTGFDTSIARAMDDRPVEGEPSKALAVLPGADSSLRAEHVTLALPDGRRIVHAARLVLEPG
jgi:hypothetical protein